jgi:RNA polymerase sigma-70 factor (ECF subfamily)
MEDSRLLELIHQNNNLAFRSLIEKYKKLVYTTAFRIVRNHPDSEDIFQDVFLEVFKSFHTIRNESDLTMWLYKISYHKSISFLRKKNPAKADRQPDYEIDASTQTPGCIDHHTPVRKLEQDEAVFHLFRLIDGLPETQKRVLLMHKFEGYSQKEIGEQLGLSVTSVESLIYRAKKSLEQKLTNSINQKS